MAIPAPVRNILLIDNNVAGCRFLKTRKHTQQRCLAAPAGTKNRKELPGRNFKANVSNRVGVLELFIEIEKSYVRQGVLIS